MKYILVGIGGMLLGGVAGFFIGEKVIKDKCDKYIDDEIAKILKETKERDLAKLNSVIKSSIDISEDKEKCNNIANNYVIEKIDKNAEVPFDVPEEKEKHNIWEDYDDQTEPDEELSEGNDDDVDLSELPGEEERDKSPYLISADQYENDFISVVPEAWDKSSLILFTDNTIAERKGKGDFVAFDSGDCLTLFGQELFSQIMVHGLLDKQEHNRIFVRNNRLRMDIELVKSPRSYKSTLSSGEGDE